MAWDFYTLKSSIVKIPRQHVIIAFGVIIVLATLVSLYSSLPPLIPSSIQKTLPHIPIPSISVSRPPSPSPYNDTKVALLIENRPLPVLAALILHFAAVMPPDWRFRFMGSSASVRSVRSSRAIQHQVDLGKLDLTFIPSNMTTGGQEEISVFLTTLWIYEQVLQPAEWLLVFQTDSILCASSDTSLDDFLVYDWVGAPWSPDSRYGGNGGLSLRHVSPIVSILRNQRRLPHSDPEDVWLTERLGHRLGGARVANGSTSLRFSGENIYTERPLGYHTGGSGRYLGSGIWGTRELREEVYGYCPEAKMGLEMDAAEYVPGECGESW